MKKPLIGFLAGIMVTASVILFSAFTPEGEKELVLIQYTGNAIYTISEENSSYINVKPREAHQQFLTELSKYKKLGYGLITLNSVSSSVGSVYHYAYFEK